MLQSGVGFFGKASPLCALVVEDDVDIRTMLGMFLQNMGFQVVAAGSGEHALILAQEHKPVLVLLDIMLPGMSGYDILTFLRSCEATKDASILMCTARRGLEDVERGLDAGADDYLQKPFEVSSLRAKVQRVLEKRGRKLP